jgi:Transposase DNA-binding
VLHGFGIEGSGDEDHSAAEYASRLDREIAGCECSDAGLGDRFRKLLAQIGSAMGQSIPLVCQNWASTKAAYRFFSNDPVSQADILAGHFQPTLDFFDRMGVSARTSARSRRHVLPPQGLGRA